MGKKVQDTKDNGQIDANGKKKVEGGIDEVCTDEQSEDQISEDDDEEIDFTKSSPRDMLPNKIRAFKIRPRTIGSECADCCESDNDDDELSIERKKKKKKESANGQRIIAFIVIFPMLITGGFMVYEMFLRYKFEKSAIQMASAVGGAGIAILVMSQVEVLRSALKFILCFSWILFLIPTYQVYSCSPVELKNDMLGTWFKLNTPARKFLEDSFITSDCMRSSKFPTPYVLSAVSLKITLKADIGELINLNMDDTENNKTSYFLLVSKRSVKKKFHKVYLIVEALEKLSDLLSNSLKLSSEDKDKNLLLITGSIYNLDESLMPMKKELESMNYFVRPLKFKVHSVQYTNRYVKLKNSANENLY